MSMKISEQAFLPVRVLDEGGPPILQQDPDNTEPPGLPPEIAIDKHSTPGPWLPTPAPDPSPYDSGTILGPGEDASLHHGAIRA